MIRCVDLFGGIGGFRLGLEQSSDQFQFVWYCDNTPAVVQIYNNHFGEKYEATDITRMDTQNIPDHDLLCAGFPCPSFSSAGYGKGFDDPRGELFFEIIRVLRAKQPQTIFLENVRGILSNDEGQTFNTVLTELGELGYLLEWQMLNSKDFGVPQHRERIFIIGHRVDNGGAHKGQHQTTSSAAGYGVDSDRRWWEETGLVFPIRARGEHTILKDVLEDEVDERFYLSEKLVERILARNGNVEEFQQLLEKPSRSLRVGGAGSSLDTRHHYDVIPVYDVYNQRLRADQESAGTLKGRGVSDTSLGTAIVQSRDTADEDEVGHTLRSGGKGGVPFYRIVQPMTDRHFQKTVYNPSGVSPTMREGHGDVVRIAENQRKFRVRRLTPIECERLQGFPDNWTGIGVEPDKSANRQLRQKFIKQMQREWKKQRITKEQMLERLEWVLELPFPQFPILDTHRYKALGNAVTVSVITHIGMRLLKCLRN